ncbi:hypothetical protein ACF0H5_019190 [Mactra antiquata]
MMNCELHFKSGLPDMKTLESSYTCGACENVFASICLLHQHLMNHGNSYHYDDVIKVAFPKLDTTCKSTQTIVDGSTSFQQSGFADNNETADVPVDFSDVMIKVEVEDSNSSDNGDWEMKGNDSMTDDYCSAENESNSCADLGKNETMVSTSEVVKKRLTAMFKSFPLKRQPKESPKPAKPQINALQSTSEPSKSTHSVEDSEEKITDYICEKISANGHIMECRKDVNYGERNEFMTVNASKTWTPHALPGDFDANKTLFAYENLALERVFPESSGVASNFLNDFSSQIYKEILDASAKSKSEELTYSGRDMDDKLETEGLYNVPVADKSLNRTSFRCEICKRDYSDTVSLRNHMNKHYGLKPYLCQDCGASFASSKTFYMHRLNQHAPKHFKCHLCDFMLPTAARLRAHLKTHTQDYKYECVLCNKFYKSKKNLHDHVQYSHEDVEKQCKLCDETFKGRKDYLKHKKICTRVSLTCEKCNRTFSDHGCLRRHMAIHSNHRPHECHICSRRFLQKGPYWIHMEKHHDLTRQDLILMFPEKHGDKHARQITATTETPPTITPNITDTAEIVST